MVRLKWAVTAAASTVLLATYVTIPPVVAYQDTIEREATRRGLNNLQAADDEEVNDMARDAAFEANDPHKFWRAWLYRRLGRSDPTAAASP